MSTYFISDLHFGHVNCLTFDNRGFDTIEEHDKTLIDRWNSVVGIDDDVWVLGDVGWYSSTKMIEIFKQLNGTKHLCIGNHDKKLLKNRDFQGQFVEIVNYKEIQLEDGKGIVLCHYPIPCFNGHLRGWVHLYGHVHISFEWSLMQQIKHELELAGKKCRMYNVGCMIPGMDFTPRTLDEILEIFEEGEC